MTVRKPCNPILIIVSIVFLIVRNHVYRKNLFRYSIIENEKEK